MIPVSLEGLFKMPRRVVSSSMKVQMSSWANFYRKLAHEARLRAVQATTVRTGKIGRGCNGVLNACRMGRAKRGDSFGARPVLKLIQLGVVFAVQSE